MRKILTPRPYQKNIQYSYLILKMCIIHFAISKSLLKLKEFGVPFSQLVLKTVKKIIENTVYVFQQ